MSIFHGAVESLSDDDDDDSENDDDSDSSYDDDTANNDDNEEMLWQRRIVGEELNYIAVRNINMPTLYRRLYGLVITSILARRLTAMKH